MKPPIAPAKMPAANSLLLNNQRFMLISLAAKVRDDNFMKEERNQQ